MNEKSLVTSLKNNADVVIGTKYCLYFNTSKKQPTMWIAFQ